MKTGFGLLVACLCCVTASADDAVVGLSQYLAKTPALVVVVCGGEEGDLPSIAGLVERTPWTVFCRGSGVTRPGQASCLGEGERIPGSPSVCRGRRRRVALAGGGHGRRGVGRASVVDPPSEQEVLRVLHPGGIGVVAGRVVVKPVEPGVDEWRHPYHEPDNNVVSQDRVARLPGELRFQTHPVFAAMPNQTLFAGGRIFFFTGHIAFHEREESLLNTLTALNAYNGLRLWSRPLDPNYVVHNVAKLATDSEVVFAEGGTLWMLDAATGRELGKFGVPAEAAAAGDTDWKWVVQEKDRLWAAFGPPDARVAPHRGRQRMGHWPWNVADEHYRGLIDNFGAARRLAAFQYPEMKLLWSVSEPEPFDARALCLEAGRILELRAGAVCGRPRLGDGERTVAPHARNIERSVRGDRQFAEAPRLGTGMGHLLLRGPPATWFASLDHPSRRPSASASRVAICSGHRPASRRILSSFRMRCLSCRAWPDLRPPAARSTRLAAACSTNSASA